ncbi:MAG TPA: hypothetical protein PLD88_01270 [Candidatus Berkiella sp.]|nr:hypothetical protein [Candidatus Berkiella sp.]
MPKRKHEEIENDIVQVLLEQGLDINNATDAEIDEFFAEVSHLDCPSIDELMDDGYAFRSTKAYRMLHHKIHCPSIDELMLEGYSKEEAVRQIFYAHMEEVEECLVADIHDEVEETEVYEHKFPLMTVERDNEIDNNLAYQGLYLGFSDKATEGEYYCADPIENNDRSLDDITISMKP